MLLKPFISIVVLPCLCLASLFCGVGCSTANHVDDISAHIADEIGRAADRETGPKLIIAVLPFKDNTGRCDRLAGALTDRIREELVKGRHVTVVSYINSAENEQIRSVLAQQALAARSDAGIINPATVVQGARQLGVQALVVGRLFEMEDAVGIDCEMYQASEGRVIEGAAANGRLSKTEIPDCYPPPPPEPRAAQASDGPGLFGGLFNGGSTPDGPPPEIVEAGDPPQEINEYYYVNNEYYFWSPGSRCWMHIRGIPPHQARIIPVQRLPNPAYHPTQVNGRRQAVQHPNQQPPTRQQQQPQQSQQQSQQQQRSANSRK